MTRARGGGSSAAADDLAVLGRAVRRALVAAVTCTLAAAQLPPPAHVPAGAPDNAAGGEAQSQPSDWTSLRRHSEKTSRAAFRACDTNADDQVSILEASRTIRGLGDAELFRRLDLNSDGYLQWPEFDRYFRDTVGRGLAVQIRPKRPLPPDVGDDERRDPAADNAKRVHQLLDKNGDGVVSDEEALQMVRDNGMPASVVQIVSGLDTDHSGDISERELLTIAQMLPQAPAAPAGPGKKKTDPNAAVGLRAADTNRDGVIDEKELGAAIGRLDPALSRWAAHIIADADDSGNGNLGPLEMRQVQRGEGKPAAPQKPAKPGNAPAPKPRG
jgi:Ca2+-binding EF-hand superfamily protein